jgi:hypothetical protein
VTRLACSSTVTGHGSLSKELRVTGTTGKEVNQLEEETKSLTHLKENLNT